MLEKPDLDDATLISCLADAYGLSINDVSFLPLGADVNTAVYRAVTTDDVAYFVKLRRGAFDSASVLVPHILRARGISHVIAPIPTRSGDLWTSSREFTVILYPFIAGESGFDRPLTDEQWVAFGDALNRMHSIHLPEEITAKLPRESFDARWRESVRAFQERVEHETFDDPAAAGLANLLRAKRDTVSHIVNRAEELGDELSKRPLDMVLCHGDIHAGNVLIDDHTMYIVDWDTLTIAPKERDLMFIGAGIGLVWNSPREEELFYRRYGRTDIDTHALAYYRYERIVQDIAEFSEELLLTDEGGADRAQSMHYFASQFQPGSVVEMAYRSDPLAGQR